MTHSATHYKRELTGPVKWEEVVELDNRWAAYQHLERSYLYIESECCAFAITSSKQPLIQLYESEGFLKLFVLSRSD